MQRVSPLSLLFWQYGREREEYALVELFQSAYFRFFEGSAASLSSTIWNKPHAFEQSKQFRPSSMTIRNGRNSDVRLEEKRWQITPSRNDFSCERLARQHARHRSFQLCSAAGSETSLQTSPIP